MSGVKSRAPDAELTDRASPAGSLTKVLGQSERVQDLVEECADELSSVNRNLKQELANGDPQPGVESALNKNEVVECMVHEASDELSVVNLALEGEVTERLALEQRLAMATEQEEVSRQAAFHDLLTGLPNRALFNDRLEHGLAQANRHGWSLAVMFLDLDLFKGINDSHGHDAGDSVLQTVARRLTENIRGDDTVSRIGGDEFLYLLMETRKRRDIALIAKKLIKAIQAPFNVSTQDYVIEVNISASIGISVFPQNGTTADALVKSADTAMYHAKRSKSGYSFVQ